MVKTLSSYDIIFNGDINIDCDFVVLGALNQINSEEEWNSLVENNKSNLVSNEDIKKLIKNDVFEVKGDIYMYNKNNLYLSGNITNISENL